jgi:hypothetical protein
MAAMTSHVNKEEVKIADVGLTTATRILYPFKFVVCKAVLVIGKNCPTKQLAQSKVRKGLVLMLLKNVSLKLNDVIMTPSAISMP